MLPYGVAMEMALTADPITAEQAQAYGLVSRVSAKGEALPTAIALGSVSWNRPG